MKICDNNKCTGCMACVNVCPQKCIIMQYNDVFELHPIVSNQCISCGKCKVVCPINNTEKNKKTTRDCYAAYSKTCQQGTSSGGVSN